MSPITTHPGKSSWAAARDEVLALKAELEQEGYWNAQLRVSMAFHSPIMAVIREEMAEFLAGIELHPPQIPVISNTTREPYPDDPEAIRRILPISPGEPGPLAAKCRNPLA